MSRRPIWGREEITATTSEPLLTLAGVCVFYGNFRATDQVDIAVGAGEVVSIIGANGAGKTTLLSAIIGQADRVEGRIAFAGDDIVGNSTEAIVRSGIRRRRG